jgi:hypothetical protein
MSGLPELDDSLDPGIDYEGMPRPTAIEPDALLLSVHLHHLRGHQVRQPYPGNTHLRKETIYFCFHDKSDLKRLSHEVDLA